MFFHLIPSCSLKQFYKDLFKSVWHVCHGLLGEMLIFCFQLQQLMLNSFNTVLQMVDETAATDFPDVVAMIAECGGVEKIGALRESNQREIADLASLIIDTYFPDEPSSQS